LERHKGSFGGMNQKMPNLLTEVLMSCPIGVVILDPNLKVVACNEKAKEIFETQANVTGSSLVVLCRDAGFENRVKQGDECQDMQRYKLAHQNKHVQFCVRIIPAHEEYRILYVEDITRLVQLESVRQEFVANLSHELKNPVASISLAIETLSELELGDEAKVFIQRIANDVQYISGILKNLSQLAELESEHIPIKLTEIYIDELISTIKTRLPESEVNRLRVQADNRLIVVDKEKVLQVILILLDNAFKFSPKDSEVELSFEASDNEIILSVKDHGPGIPPEAQQRIFERFFKLEPSRTRSESGSGLGLAIAKHLTTALGGYIWVETPPGGGSCFKVAFPAKPVDKKAQSL